MTQLNLGELEDELKHLIDNREDIRFLARFHYKSPEVIAALIAEVKKWKLLEASSERKLEYIKMGIQDHFLAAIEERDRYLETLKEIINTLGPDKIPESCENKCDGCRFEMMNALTISKEALNPKGEK